MAEKALIINGVTRLVWVDPLTEDTWKATEHQYRRLGVIKRRQYYEGEQYDQDNVLKKQELYPALSVTECAYKRLPEHQRKHAYSSQLREGVDFLANQLTGSMYVEADDAKVGSLIEDVSEESGFMRRKQEIVKEMLIAGDVFVRVKPDQLRPLLEPDAPAVKVEFWQAEDVEVDYSDDDWQQMVEVRYERTRIEEGFDDQVEEVRYVHKFTVEYVSNDDGGDSWQEAVETVYRENLDTPVEVNRLGLPFLPWVHMHGEQEELRSKYGRPVLTGQLMETADRYNAVCQLEFLAVRYNSFGTLAVVGDAAALQVDQGKVIHKDVADVISFPGGTGVTDVSLSIDVEAYGQSKGTMVSEMYQLMGLTRIDDESMEGMGNLSGYALEILNRKTDGTFRALVENFEDGLREMWDMALDVDAYARAPVEGWQTVDPMVVYPNRDIEMTFGTVYIVDEVAVRDDFVADVISRNEALRQKGYSEPEITRIEKEIADEQDAAETALSTSLSTGSRLSTERG